MKKNRLLIVEDEYIVARDLEDRLIELGYAVAGRSDNGPDSIRLAEEHRPDLVLMDIYLSGPMDGIAAAQEIRRRQNLPVVFVTAYAEDTTLFRARTVSPHGYVLKPFEDRELRIVLEMALARHSAERKLEMRERELTAILNSTIEGFVRCDDEGRILEVNQAYCQMLGYSREELLQMKLRDVDADDAPEHVAHRLRDIAQAGAAHLERRNRRKDGRLIHVELSVTAIPSWDEGLFCFLRDITQRRRADELTRVHMQLANLSADTPLDDLMQSVLDAAERLTDSSIGFFHFVDPDQENLTLQAWSTNTLAHMCTAAGKGSHYPISHAGVWVDCFHARTAVIHNDYARLPHKKGLPPGHAAVVRELAVPVLRDARVVAILGVGNKPTDYTQDDVRQVESLASTVIDLVTRKKAEEELRQNNELLYAILQNTFTMAVYLDTKFNFIWVNQAYAQTCHRDPSFFPGKNHFELYPHAENQAIFQRVVDTGQPFFAQAKAFTFPDQPERGLTYWDWSLWPVVNPKGGIKGLVLSLVDVTSRIRLNREIEGHRAELQAIHDHVPILLCLADEERRILRVNRAVTRFSGRAFDPNGPAPRCGDLFDCAHRQEAQVGREASAECPECPIRAAIAATLSTGQNQSGLEATLKLNRAGGIREVRMRISSVRLTVEDKPRVLLCLEDITEQRSLEEKLHQSQKMESIGRLAGGIAHDFNNILAASMMNLALLEAGEDLSTEAKGVVRELESGFRRAGDLTRQLLVFSRRSVLQPQPLDLNSIVENLLRMLKRLIGETIQLVLRPERPLPLIQADVSMMEQLVMNLCLNARDAMTSTGTLTLTTSVAEIPASPDPAKPARRPGRFVCLEVQDTGCGMDEATLSRIFEPFFTTKPVGKGTGLGLATADGIVAQHGGWVEVESTVGQGSCFRVYLPTASAALPDATESSAQTVDHRSPPRGSETILLVEDEGAVRRTIAQCLRQMGYRVMEAGSGPEAIALWQNHPPRIDLLFTDMVMPGGMSGLELAQELRRLKPGLKVILTSGYNDETAGQLPPQEVGLTYLPKPYAAKRLGEAVRACLDHGTAH